MTKEPGTTEQEIREQVYKKLSRMEDEILKTLAALQKACDARWMAIGRTQLEQGFMAIKRAVNEGRRVGD